MMKRSLTVLCFTFLLTLAPIAAYAQEEPYEIYTANGDTLSIHDMGKLITQYDVIIFGEYHDNQALHQLEEDFLKTSYQYNKKIAISLEMFEKDVQSIMDAYLKGEMEEQNFLIHSRPWNNYQEAYRPLIEFAKSNNLNVIAANIPRTIASQYAKTGSLHEISPEMRGYIPQHHVITEGEYKKKFKQQMLLLADNPNMKWKPDQIENFYKAQCLKDDAMAESIMEYKNTHADEVIIHYNGDFHSKYYLGVAEKIRLLHPDIKMAVITPLIREEGMDIKQAILQNKQAGDIFIFLKK
jgi:uncharacterized iron-regulated protein